MTLFQALLRSNVLRGNCGHPVFLHCGADDDVNALSLVDHEDDGYLYSSCDLDLFVQQKPELDRTFSTPAATSLRSRIDLGSLQVRNNRLLSENAIVAIVEKHLAEGVSWVLFAYMLGQKLAERETVNHIATLPNRHPLIRAIAAGFVAERDTPEKAVTEVQCLNVLPHPKYRAPMADRLSVIDKSAAELYSDYFGFTREDIIVCGAPQDDGLLNRVASRDWNSVASEMDAAAKVTDSVSHELVDTIVSAIERVDTDLGELLNRLRPALWLYFRPLLINAAREDYRAAACVRECTSSLLLLAGSHEELIDLSRWSTAFAPEYITRRAALVRSKKVQTFKNVDRLLSEQSTITRTKHQPLETLVDLKVISDWLAALSETPFIETSRSETLFLLDWSLKTVPGTIGPVIRQMADTRMLIACFRSKDVKTVDQFIADEGLAETGTLSPDELMSTAPEFGNHASDALRSIVAGELDELLSRQSSPFIKTALRSAVEQFGSSGFPKILSWHQFCKQFFEQGGQMTVACPGRQWYSEIAHLQAAQAQGFSATIQNAYMTAAYTYTAPSGDFITCIDTWTRELLIDEYGVEAEKLAVVSTPRFDYIANIKNGSKEDARAVLLLSAEPTIVLFATQVGLETNTVQIINGLKTTASSNDGRPVLVLVKPHPRTDDTELKTIRDAVADCASIELLEDMSISLETLLVASDIVITIYSNVGIEAAVCEKDLIVFKPDGMALPLPLDEYEIGWTVETADDIPHAIHGFQTNSETALAVRDRQARFRSDNPHMTNGTSAEEISRTLLDKLSSKV